MQHKLYVITRGDLPSNIKAVQAGHALAQCLLDGKHGAWDNGTLVYLEVKNEAKLYALKDRLDLAEIPYSMFKEEDMNFELTALAAYPQSNILRRLSLMQ